MIKKTGKTPFSARFYPARDGVPLNALLDYILVGPNFGINAKNWRIWNPYTDPEIQRNTGLKTALITVSDHFPITYDIQPDSTKMGPERVIVRRHFINYGVS